MLKFENKKLNGNFNIKPQKNRTKLHVKLSPLVNVKRNDMSVDVNFSPNLAMATSRYGVPSL